MMSNSEEGGAQQPTPPPLPPPSTGIPKINPTMEPHCQKSVPKPPPTPTTWTPFTHNIAAINQDQPAATQHNDGSKGSEKSSQIPNPSDQNKTGKSSMQFSTHF